MKKPKTPPPGIASILSAALKRKQARQPGYSLRALARDLGVSPAFASGLLSGKKMPPRERLEQISYSLELDVIEKELFVKAALLDSFSAKVLTKARLKRPAKKSRASRAPDKNVLSTWMNLAVLEGLTLSAPHREPESLRRRLGISATQMKQALGVLAAAGLIEDVKGRWKKKEELLYFAGGRSRPEIRAFHEMMITKAREELAKSSQEDYERRLINGFTLALNPAHLERLKAKVIGFLDELSREAAEGSCREVYQINFQLFPLTKKLAIS